MKTHVLHSWWQEALPQAETTLSELCFNELIARYSEPQRYYHNTAHIHQLLYLIDSQDLTPINRQILIFVAFFHDAFYQSGNKQNEANSAELAAFWLPQLGIKPEIISVISNIILETANHKSGHNLGQLFMDMDLAILASNDSDYQLYINNIRRENPVPQILFAFARRRFIKSCLNQKQLFTTPEFYHLEFKARRNLQKELNGEFSSCYAIEMVSKTA